MLDIEMNSYDFLNKVINPARISAGEKEIRYRDFMSRHVFPELRFNKDECKLLINNGAQFCAPLKNNDLDVFEIVVDNENVYQKNKVIAVTLSRRNMLKIGVKLSMAVRDATVDYIERLEEELWATQKELHMREIQQLRDEKIHEEVLRTDNSFHTLHIEKKLRMKHGEAIKSYQDDLWNMRESITRYRIRAEQAESRLQNEKEICQMYKQKFLGK